MWRRGHIGHHRDDMRTSPPRVLAAVTAALCLLGACGGDDDEASSPTTEPPETSSTTESTTTTTTAAHVEPTGPVPDEITPAYVEAVFGELNGLITEAARGAVEEQALGERFTAFTQATFVPDSARSQTAGIEQLGGASAFNADPQAPTFQLEELPATSADCIFAHLTYDVAPLVAEPVAATQPYYLQLVPAEPSTLNPTPWKIAYLGFLPEGQTAKDPCP